MPDLDGPRQILGQMLDESPQDIEPVHAERRWQLQKRWPQAIRPAEDFRKTINSFAVQTKVRRAMTLAGRYGISGVPAMVVDGKYRSGSSVGGYPGLVRLTNFLVDKARADKAGAAQAAPVDG